MDILLSSNMIQMINLYLSDILIFKTVITLYESRIVMIIFLNQQKILNVTNKTQFFN